MTRLMLLTTAALAALTVCSGVQADENWPQWRGPSQNGIGDGTNLPVSWSSKENIVWKTELPSWSGGTPVIWGGHIFLTSASKSQNPPAPPAEQLAANSPRRRPRRPQDPGGQSLLLLCLSKSTGQIRWTRELDVGNEVKMKQNNSSPSPVTDGAHVWAVTGTGAVTAFDFDGNRIWRRKLQEDYGAFGLGWGYASSPMLYGGKLIIQVLHGRRTDDPSYILALDALTGKEIWRQERPTDALNESPDSYTTPVLSTYGGKAEIVISGGDYVTGHNPDTGAEVWRAAGLNPRRSGNFRIIASPVAVDGMIYAPTRVRPLLALRAGGKGDITKSHLAWQWNQSYAPDVPTPICDGTYFYMVDDKGVVSCLDAKTGEAIWGPEHTAQGIVSASPLLADGKIYITNEQAVTTVVAAGPKFELLGTNELDGSFTLSSPVVSGTQLFVRTSTHLYCIEG